LVIGALSHVVALDKKDRDEYFQKRDMIGTKMTPAQIIEAQKLAREWAYNASFDRWRGRSAAGPSH
jgi:hypothetical protein